MHLSFSRGDLCSNLVSLWHALLKFPKLSGLYSVFSHPIISVKLNPIISSCDSQGGKKNNLQDFPFQSPGAQVLSPGAKQQGNLCVKQPEMWPVSGDRCLMLQYNRRLATPLQICNVHKKQWRPILKMIPNSFVTIYHFTNDPNRSS